METYKVVSWDGSTSFFSAYTETDARQQAEDFCEGKGGVKEFEVSQQLLLIHFLQVQNVPNIKEEADIAATSAKFTKRAALIQSNIDLCNKQLDGETDEPEKS